jgi:hypothetical protein
MVDREPGTDANQPPAGPGAGGNAGGGLALTGVLPALCDFLLDLGEAVAAGTQEAQVGH